MSDTKPDQTNDSVDSKSEDTPTQSETTENSAENTSPEEVVAETESEPVSNETPKTEDGPNLSEPDNSGSTKKQIISVVIILIALAGVAYFTTNGFLGSESEAGDDIAALSLNLNADDPIAFVNGTKISQGEYAQQMDQAEAVLAAYGGAGEDTAGLRDQLSQQIVTDLVNAELLFQNAETADISVTTEEVEAELSNTKEQVIAQAGGDESAYENQLSVLGLTEDSLRELIERQLTIDAYVSQQITTDDPEKTNEQLQAEFTELIDRLRAEAEIEVLI